jgi:hypothetical protein
LADKLVTIARFTDYIQAELTKQHLDGSGIKAVITGQNVANIYSGLPFVGGSIQLQVAEDKAQEALEILSSQSEGQPWTCSQCGQQIEEQLSTCWNCGTGNDGSPPNDEQGFRFARNRLLVPPTTDTDSPSTAADLSPDHKHAFDLLYQSEELEDLLRYTPSSIKPKVWSTFWISLGLLLIALAIIGRLESPAGAVLIILGAYPLLIGLYDLFKFGMSPLKRLPGIVETKTKKNHLGYEHSGSGGTVLLVKIETQDGHSFCFNTSLEVFSKVEQEDVGIAYIKGDRMLDFKKIGRVRQDLQ